MGPIKLNILGTQWEDLGFGLAYPPPFFVGERGKLILSHYKFEAMET